MNCYLCLVETAGLSRPACGVCQHCGAGICERHLVVVQYPLGMAGGRRRTLVCASCSRAGEPPSTQRRGGTQQHQKEQEVSTRWIWFHRRKQTSALPEPAQVVVAVEQFLKQQRDH